MPDLAAQAQAEAEARERAEPRAFAYPCGRHDASVVAAVREAGFRAAFTTRAGVATRDSDPYRLPRIEVRRFDSRLRLGLRLAAARAPPPVHRMLRMKSSAMGNPLHGGGR
jgi:hypothetical protein